MPVPLHQWMGDFLSEPQGKTIRSFVRRQGRMTASQHHALEQLWSKYGFDWVEQATAQPIWQWFQHTKSQAVTTNYYLDIGFGNGESLLTMAVQNPDDYYLGIEVYSAGVGHVLLSLEQQQLTNVKLFKQDVHVMLEQGLIGQDFAGVYLLFPDPWPKKRHHKRRIVQTAWLDLIASRLRANGFLYIATDWGNYAQHIQAIVGEHSQFEAIPAWPRPETKFERRGKRLGHAIWNLAYRRR